MSPKSTWKIRGKRRRWKHRKQDKQINNSVTASSECGDANCSSNPSPIPVDEDDAQSVSDEQCEAPFLTLISQPDPLDEQCEAPFLTLTSQLDPLDVSCEVETSESHGYTDDLITRVHDHMEPCVDSAPARHQVHMELPGTEDIAALLLQAHQRLLLGLPPFWVPYVEAKRLSVMLLSRQNEKSVQRTLRCYPNGDMELSVHCNPIPLDPFLKPQVRQQVQLMSSSVIEFCDRIVQVVKNVRLWEVCAGMDKIDYCDVWNACLHVGEVDTNPYQEWRYTKTFRSLACLRLVESSKRKCQECVKLTPFLRRSQEQARKGIPHACVRNDFLTEDQKLKKIKIQREKIEKQKKKLHKLKNRIEFLIAKDGVIVEENLSNDLKETLQSEKLTPAQSMVFQQQVKASEKNFISF